MAVKLNNQAFDHATKLIEQGKFVFDEKDMWSEHAAAHLHGMIDAAKGRREGKSRQ